MLSFRRRFNSLTFRVVAFSTVWAVVALVVISTVISSLFRQVSERGFESLLTAHLFNLISSVGVGDDGRLEGTPNLGDLRFTVPRSGWYWSVEPVSGVSGQLSSLSLTQPVASPPSSEVPFSSEFQRSYVANGLDGETIEVFESEFVLDGDNSIARFRVMGNRTELEADISEFEHRLYLYLTIFGAGMIAINALAIIIGLDPLRRVSRALAEIRAGAAQRLDGNFPVEPEPPPVVEHADRIVNAIRPAKPVFQPITLNAFPLPLAGRSGLPAISSSLLTRDFGA